MARVITSEKGGRDGSMIRKAGCAAAVLAVVAAVFATVAPATALAATPPTVTSVVSSSGPTVGGTKVVIKGTGFVGLSGASAVKFGDKAAAGYTVNSATQITAVCPASAPGPVHVSVTAAGLTSSPTARDYFTFMVRYDQKDARLKYAGSWTAFARTWAWKGSYGRSSTSGASVTMTFNGTRLDWLAMKGTTTGIADVYLDGVFRKTIDLASATAVYQQRVWSTGTVAGGTHVVKIVRSSKSAAGRYLTIDAVDILGSLTETLTRFEQDDTRLRYSGVWAGQQATDASKGSLTVSAENVASLLLTFTGTRLDWIAVMGPAMGKAKVTVDGGTPVSVDLHSGTTDYRKKVWSTGTLASRAHTVKIAPDSANPAGVSINVDAFDVAGAISWPTTLTTAEVKWAEKRLTDLSYRPGTVDGVFDTRTKAAVMAFEKWEGLTRDGAIGQADWTRLQTATRPKPAKTGSTNPWLEVNKTKQVLLYCKNGAVVWTLPCSTGSATVYQPSPSGTWKIWKKTQGTSAATYWPMYYTDTRYWYDVGLAIHGHYSVPAYPASHGCVRLQYWDQEALWPLIPLQTTFYLY